MASIPCSKKIGFPKSIDGSAVTIFRQELTPTTVEVDLQSSVWTGRALGRETSRKMRLGFPLRA